MSIAHRKFSISGPAGKLEAVLGEPSSNPRGIGIIAHPHPLHGGTMDNKVVQTVFTTLLELDFITVKFNFRGVGQSEGTFAHGAGEIEDAVAVTQAIREQFGNHFADLPLLLAGFSFGGAVQLFAAKELAPEFLILIAPSVAKLNAPMIPGTTQCALIIQGDKDDIVLPQEVLAWAEPASQPVVVIPGAGHFFHGKLMTLRRLIWKYFSERTQ
ncbi:MAG: alpha/beta hydrolase [Nitrosomonas sp.]|uniref:alpha/beta hydrolase n=1 Tax=Nitrosomonas sp. TaxID=42353 RepID=UPI001E087F90|nr:alpha/beta hydrolase [Nitrosomonas sp.]MBX9896131.1 alpha/beta hydrolase [Nitrosomonas sp.]